MGLIFKVRKWACEGLRTLTTLIFDFCFMCLIILDLCLSVLEPIWCPTPRGMVAHLNLLLEVQRIRGLLRIL